MVFCIQEQGMASAGELHKQSDPGAEVLIRRLFKDFCMDARYSQQHHSMMTGSVSMASVFTVH